VVIRVLIVDDHSPFRVVARELLELAGFEVVAEAGDAESGLAAMRRVRPALVLLDIGLPGVDGFELARWLAQEPEPPAVVFVSGQDGLRWRRRIAASGALGFIPKWELSGAALIALVG
jgi:DNA-binding NarL/FixJ family response regulator